MSSECHSYVILMLLSLIKVSLKCQIECMHYLKENKKDIGKLPLIRILVTLLP